MVPFDLWFAPGLGHRMANPQQADSLNGRQTNEADRSPTIDEAGPLRILAAHRPRAAVIPYTAPVRQDTLYYDGMCGLCQRSVRILNGLDWLNAFKAVDQSALSDAELPVPRELALEGIPMRTHDGRVLVGMPAVRRALRRTPLGLLPALLMHLPILATIADGVYRWIAANRKTQACRVGTLPPPERTP